MELVRFEARHILILDQWFKARGLPIVPSTDIAACGFIAFIDSIPVAAMFLRKCEGDVGIVDGLIANPECDWETRNEGINAVISRVLEEAKQLGIIKILSFSENYRTVCRVTRDFGFSIQPGTVLVKKL